MLTLLVSIFIFLILILVHELGHFMVAKSVGIKVNEFSIGMGPLIYENKKGETKYSLRLIPVGGFVSMEGEDEDSDDPDGFSNAPTLAKIAVVAAGAIMNFILAVIIFMIVAQGMGMPVNKVEEVLEGSPAEISGMVQGDEIKKIGDVKIEKWEDIINTIGASELGEELNIEIDRDGEKLDLNMITTEEEGRVVIGVVPARERTIGSSIKAGFLETGNFIKSIFNVFKMLFTGQLSMDNLSGPVGVVKEIGATTKRGVFDVLYFMGFISVNLGVFNLLPIPALDGGRLFFLIIELLRGKPMDPNKEGMVHFVGFVLLIALMIFVSYRDIIGLIMGE